MSYVFFATTAFFSKGSFNGSTNFFIYITHLEEFLRLFVKLHHVFLISKLIDLPLEL